MTVGSIERKLPANEALERELISAFLYGHKDSAFVFDALQEDFFMDAIYRRIYAAGKKLYLAGKPFDVVSVSDAMDPADLQSVGGMQGLAEISVGMFTAYNVEHGCGIVTKKAQQRALKRARTDRGRSVGH
jgi:replicative DNA helicase